jgi:hypothetical protein
VAFCSDIVTDIKVSVFAPLPGYAGTETESRS